MNSLNKTLFSLRPLPCPAQHGWGVGGDNKIGVYWFLGLFGVVFRDVYPEYGYYSRFCYVVNWYLVSGIWYLVIRVH